MTGLDAFDPADRDRIAAMPMFAGMAVTAADPSGLFGAIKESAAMAKALNKARDSKDNPLISAAVESFSAPEGRSAVTAILKEQVKGKDPKGIADSLIGEISRLSGIIAEKAPDAAPGFNSWLIDIAQSVAEASKEGGFLGFGGVKVSPEETATIERLKSALSSTAAPAPTSQTPPPVA
ncbi:hypothetical protein CN97_16265 [Haematobacter massiliensis]|uniref:Uncharacterized protein n=1 Tax=Haematobacter massiliensis TaxID=195105 RepID=A0A086Y4N3_9RHOB|nr:hypothetical protein [Haematobacter massiliensis]KFI29233.1 hypothetical protein CN97_16265 [Haematobacter massiliensis]OWJ82181.1 hypothetical protein CDV51_18330 [Haematobacter massiliensis]QBJ25851.1 hypothetical protein HmaOT1_16035 [Haematobacter massiliensis]